MNPFAWSFRARMLIAAGACFALIAFAIHKTMGFRIAPEDEVGGIDLSEHRESAYDLEVALAYTGATDEAGELEKH